MSADPDVGPRERAARTKRERTRRALLDAAGTLLAERGWHGTRMEDVAARAGVSSATTYNHFPSKGLLVAHVFSPLVVAPIAVACGFLESDAPVPVADAIAAHVHDLAAVFREHEDLTLPLVSALQEHVVRVRRAADPVDPHADSDPRVVAPLGLGIERLVEHGQAAGDLRPFPSPSDVANLTVSQLLSRTLRRGERAEESAEIVLTILLGTLRPQDLVAAGPTGRTYPSRPDV